MLLLGVKVGHIGSKLVLSEIFWFFSISEVFPIPFQKYRKTSEIGTKRVVLKSKDFGLESGEFRKFYFFSYLNYEMHNIINIISVIFEKKNWNYFYKLIPDWKSKSHIYIYIYSNLNPKKKIEKFWNLNFRYSEWKILSQNWKISNQNWQKLEIPFQIFVN